MIIELDINGARVIVSGENLSISVTEGDIQRRFAPVRAAVPVKPVGKRQVVLETDSPLTAWRKRAGLRQYELAAMLGVTRRYIGQIETGVHSASKRLVVKIGELCGDAVPVASLVRRAA